MRKTGVFQFSTRRRKIEGWLRFYRLSLKKGEDMDKKRKSLIRKVISEDGKHTTPAKVGSQPGREADRLKLLEYFAEQELKDRERVVNLCNIA